MYNVEEKKEVSGASINGRLNGDIDDKVSQIIEYIVLLKI